METNLIVDNDFKHDSRHLQFKKKMETPIGNVPFIVINDGGTTFSEHLNYDERSIKSIIESANKKIPNYISLHLAGG